MSVTVISVPTNLFGHEFEPVVDRDALRCWKCRWEISRQEWVDDLLPKLRGGGWKLTECTGEPEKEKTE